MISDLITTGFNLAAGAFVMLNVRRVWRDREVAGVSLWAVAFFTTWGLWNVAVFYPSVGCSASVVGGMGAFLSNTVYLVVLIHFRRKAR